jgi:hypothetical protein
MVVVKVGRLACERVDELVGSMVAVKVELKVGLLVY